VFAALQIGRAFWLGDPLAIPLHRLENGGLLLFAFFMISDPKTTPDSRIGRLVFAALVASGAYYVQFRLFRTNGLLWSLAICSFVVPLLDWRFPGQRYVWSACAPSAFAPAALRRDSLRSSVSPIDNQAVNPQSAEVSNAPLPVPHSVGRVSVGLR
jgi:hypothetical protein